MCHARSPAVSVCQAYMHAPLIACYLPAPAAPPPPPPCPARFLVEDCPAAVGVRMPLLLLGDTGDRTFNYANDGLVMGTPMYSTGEAQVLLLALLQV